MRKIKLRIWVTEKDIPNFVYITLGDELSEYENRILQEFKYTESTGFIDSRGQEIYEGDIVQCTVTENADHYILLEAGKRGYVYRTVSVPEVYQEGLPDDCEIVGNIFENIMGPLELSKETLKHKGIISSHGL